MVAIPFIFFIGIFCFFYIRNKMWGVDLAATLLLIVISFCAIMIDANNLYGDFGINFDNITFPSVLLFCFQWTLVLFPLHYISSLTFEKHPPIKTFLLYILFIGVTLSSFIMIAVSLSDIKEALIMDMADVRDEHYSDLNSGGAGGEANYFLFIPQILVSTPIPTLALFSWFYMKAFMKCPFLLRAGILIASIVQAALAIIMAGRAALVYWVFDFFLIYSFFYRYLNRRVKWAINLSTTIVGGLIMFLFISITLARFDGSNVHSDPFESLYGYAGQHVNNFCTMIEKGGDSPLLFDRIFPLATKITTGESFDLAGHYDDINTHVNVLVNVFDTFGGEIYLDLGWFGYILFMFMLILLMIYMKYQWHELTFYRMFAIVIFISFFTRALFAWPFTGHYTTIALMLTFSMCYMFKYAFKI